MAAAAKKTDEKITSLDPYPTLDSVPLQFSIECCNTKKTYFYDLRLYPVQYQALTYAFAWSIFQNRSTVGHSTREGYLTAVRIFYSYLDAIDSDHRPHHPSEISTPLLRHYAQWLKQRKNRAYKTQSVSYRSLGALIKRWPGRPWATLTLTFPKGQFPSANATGSTRKPYSDDELKQILKALRKNLEQSAKRLEKDYSPTYLNQPPPIDDVAPFDEELPVNIQHNPWKNRGYQIWWWETFCKCKRLKASQVAKIHGAYSFLKSLNNPDNCIYRGTAESLEIFYDEIGAGENYIEKFANNPCPITYFNRWKKLEYLRWYWENYCNCSVEVHSTMRQKYPRFVNAVREHHGSLGAFFRYVGVQHQLTTTDLIPYYIALLVSTALNPTTIQTLEVDCLVPDPLDSKKLSIKWTKLRSRQQDQTIPISRLHGLSPVSIVERLIKLTKAFRSKEQTKLFITNSANSGSRKGYALSPKIFARAVNEWFSRNGISSDPNQDGEALLATAGSARFRNTIALYEYRRTGELGYVQTLLSHSRSEMTSSYIKKGGDPILRFRRGIHLDALFIGLTIDREAAISHIELHGVSSQNMRQQWKQSMHAHCRDPLSSPIHGQRIGTECNAHDVCLYCPNLVITPEDIFRYFSFLFYHAHLLEIGELDLENFNNIVGDRKYMFENHILPRYSDEVVNQARDAAQRHPAIEWEIASLP